MKTNQHTAYEVLLKRRGRVIGWVGIYTIRGEARRQKRAEQSGAIVARTRVDDALWAAIGGGAVDPAGAR